LGHTAYVDDKEYKLQVNFSIHNRSYNNSFYSSQPGKTGRVVLENGDRTPILELRNFQYSKPVHVCTFQLGAQNDMCVNNKQVNIMWPGGVTTAPLDSPPCGFQGEKCDGKLDI